MGLISKFIYLKIHNYELANMCVWIYTWKKKIFTNICKFIKLTNTINISRTNKILQHLY